MKTKFGHQGYVFSRPILGDRVPQHVQNLVIREYCNKHNFKYLLSGTEYIMPECYIILEELVQNASKLSGIVLYSIFMLPKSFAKRHDIYDQVLSGGASLHSAVEELVITKQSDISQIEDLWYVKLATTNSEPSKLKDIFREMLK